MPWKETCVMDERVKLIADWLSKEYSITDLNKANKVGDAITINVVEASQASNDAQTSAGRSSVRPIMDFLEVPRRRGKPRSSRVSSFDMISRF